MIYQFYLKKNDMLHMTERHSLSRIAYYSKQKMNQLYPDGGYDVIGEINNFSKKYSDQDYIVTDAGKRIPIFPRGSLMKPFEWVAGFVAVGEDIYVAVVRSIIPHRIWQCVVK